MKRLWYLEILEEDPFLVRASIVFDGGEPEDPVEGRARDPADLEAILRRLKPFARLPRRYREINGLGSLLRVASLPRTPSEEIVSRALEDLGSASPFVLITPLLTRAEVARCLSGAPETRKH